MSHAVNAAPEFAVHGNAAPEFAAKDNTAPKFSAHGNTATCLAAANAGRGEFTALDNPPTAMGFSAKRCG